MFKRTVIHAAAAMLSLAIAAAAATFGTVVPIGGHASDIALDESRGRVYVANYTAGRIDVIDTNSLSRATAINVAALPASLALSWDRRYLVVAHYGGTTAPLNVRNVVTVLDLQSASRREFSTGDAPVSVAFGVDNLALIVTTKSLLLLDPASGTLRMLTLLADLKPMDLPVKVGTFPPQIITASTNTSADGRFIYGVAESGEGGTDTSSMITSFQYDVLYGYASVLGYTTAPALGPRTVSVNKDGSAIAVGWALLNRRGTLLAEFEGPMGNLSIGGHAFDPSGTLIYAEVPEATGTDTISPPVLMIRDADNLNIRERLQLAEHLAGKAAVTSDGSMMFALSASGVTALPVGKLSSVHRVAAQQEDLLFRGSFCERGVGSQQVDIVNPGGGATPFQLVASDPAISLSANSGITPARITVMVDFSQFQNNAGTTTAYIDIKSPAAVNIPQRVRILINNRQPDQRGDFINVPGKLVDIIADRTRNRFYVLRQDRNQVLVFDGSSYQQIATLRTGNTPWSMAITMDGQYLIVGNDNSQIANVFELDTLQPDVPIVFPGGHYPRWIAVSSRSLLASSRVAGPKHQIDVIQFPVRFASTLPTLGIFENDIDVDTALVATPSGSSVFAAMADGRTMVYSADADTFVAARQDFTSLSGAVAAPSDSRFLVDVNLLNDSLVPVQHLESATGASSGFVVADGLGVRATSLASNGPGVLQRVDLANNVGGVRPIRTGESPLLGDAVNGSTFTRTLAALSNRSAFVMLSASGFMAMPWTYDAALLAPHIDSVVNAADHSPGVAPGGLVTIAGYNLAPTTALSGGAPLPTILAETCLTLNGYILPMILVSPSQINAQIPFQVSGSASLTLHTPGGVSDSFLFTVQQTAPAVFHSSYSGQDVAAVVRYSNNSPVTVSNPVHLDDRLVIYLTGMGLTSPGVDSGAAAPVDPLAFTIAPPSVTLGGVDLPVAYSGLTPGQVGVYQVNVIVPFRNLPTGWEVPLVINAGGASTSLNVRVVE